MILSMYINLLLRFKYPIIFILFILVNVFTLNNLPWGDDFPFIFDSNIKDPKSLFVFWNPFSDYFKSWPLAYSVLWIFLKLFGKKFFYFRLLNLTLHILNAYLVKKVAEQFITSKHKNLVVFIVCASFLFHPISQFTINWIFQIKTLLSMCFGLLSIICINNIKKNNFKYSVLAILSFFFALNGKVAVVLLPIYLLFKKKDFKESTGFFMVLSIFFLLSGYYGLINIKGINAVWSEKKNIERSVVDYRQDEKVMDREEELYDEAIAQFEHKSLQDELATSLDSLSVQIIDTDKLFEKIALNFFTFGRYINSSLGLNRYSIVYEKNIDSFSPLLFFGFSIISFLYLFFFVRRENFETLMLCFLFFLPIGGLFYVPYMKISFISDHWFYISLPFFLIATFNHLNKKTLSILFIVIITQSLFMSYHYRSSDSIIRYSISNYQNTFLDEYHARLAMASEDFHYAFNKINNITKDHSLKKDNIVKAKLILNMKHIKGEKLWSDAKDYISYIYTEGNLEGAKGILNSLEGKSNPVENYLIKSFIQIKENKFSEQMYINTFKLLTNGKSLRHVHMSLPGQTQDQK